MNQDPRHFAAELDELRARLITMGGLAEEGLRVAVKALVDRDQGVLADVIAGDSRIDDLEMEIDRRCFTLLALHHPVATDLRTVVAVLAISADISCIRRSNH